MEYFISVELHTTDFDNDIDGCSDATHQEITTGPESSSVPYHASSDYRLSPLLFDRSKPVSDYIPLIQFWHSVTQPQTQTKINSTYEVHHATRPKKLEDWQTEEE